MFYIFPRVITPEGCDEIVKDLLTHQLQTAKVETYNGVSRDNPDIRKTSIYYIPTNIKSKASDIARYFLKQANNEHFHYDLELFEGVQFAEYKDGGFYDWHQDSSTQDSKTKLRKLSLTFVLSDPNNFEGGELQFWNGTKPMLDYLSKEEQKQTKDDMQAQGTIIIFDSRDWHRVTPVTKGVRHSIVCWSTGVPFK